MVPYVLKMTPEKWIEKRIELFFEYCYPSVKNQSYKNFKWLVYFDSRTPKDQLEIISKLDKEGIIEFKFTDHWDKMNNDILNHIKLDLKTNQAETVISTRLDCDDAISDFFVQTIQNEVLKNKINTPYAINPINGLILEETSNIFFLKKMLSNPFISLVQSASDLDISIFGMEHQKIFQKTNTINVETPKMWLQVVHGDNLLNKASGLPIPKNMGRIFHLDRDADNPGILQFGKSFINYLSIRFNNLKIKLKGLDK